MAKNKYERCAEILRAALNKAKSKTGLPYTVKLLASDSKISTGTLNACLQGTRYLNEKNALKVAQCLGLSESESGKFQEETRAAREAADQNREIGRRDDLADPNASLRVEGLRYLPFSDEEKFVDLFL